jgi:hypothetical protein
MLVSFRSRQIHGVQDCVERMHKEEMGPTMRPAVGPRRSLSPALLRSLLTSSSDDPLFLKKMTWQKD